MSVRLLVAALVAATGTTSLVAAAGTTSLLPVKFAPRPGWYVGVGKADACPGVSANRCSRVSSWASTVRWRDCSYCLPHRTVAALPPAGVAIQISLVRENPRVA